MSIVCESPKIIIFAGSVRRGSYNQLLANVAADKAEASGAAITRLHLGEYPAPVYDANLEADSGIPESMKDLKRLFESHDGFLAVSPEYNGSIPALLKNMIDWLSRRGDDAKSLLPFRGKVAALMAASPGRLGGIRVLTELRRVLSGIGTLVIPAQYSLPHADKAFDGNGRLLSEVSERAVERVVEQLLQTAQKLR